MKAEPGFTLAETKAFDRGVVDAEASETPTNPFNSTAQHDLWDAWETGASVGSINRRWNPLLDEPTRKL